MTIVESLEMRKRLLCFSGLMERELHIASCIILEVYTVICVFPKGLNIIILRRPKSISADSLALSKFDTGQKKIEAKLGSLGHQFRNHRSRRGHHFRNHQFRGVSLKLVLKSCCSIQPRWTILALLPYLTCREHGVRETTFNAVVVECRTN